MSVDLTGLHNRLADALAYRQAWSANDYADALLPIVLGLQADAAAEELEQLAVGFRDVQAPGFAAQLDRRAARLRAGEALPGDSQKVQVL